MIQIFDFLSDFIYPAYTLAVILVTWLLRAAVPVIDKRYNPKLTAAFMGVLIAIPGVIYKHIIIDADNIMKLIISFAMAAFLYDYTIYFIQKKFSKPQ
jgi:hypothetical protein